MFGEIQDPRGAAEVRQPVKKDKTTHLVDEKTKRKHSKVTQKMKNSTETRRLASLQKSLKTQLKALMRNTSEVHRSIWSWSRCHFVDEMIKRWWAGARALNSPTDGNALQVRLPPAAPQITTPP